MAVLPGLAGLLGGRDGKADGSLWAIVTTVIAFLAVARTVLPPEARRLVRRLFQKFYAYLDPYSTFTIHEFAGTSPDQVGQQCNCTKPGPCTTLESRIHKPWMALS